MQSPQEILNDLKNELLAEKKKDTRTSKSRTEKGLMKYKYKICFEATKEFSNQYDGIRKFATLGEFQARLTVKIGVKDDMRGASKQEQDEQLRKL